jgi:hypothetical protein
MIRYRARALYQAKNLMKDCFPQLRSARQTFVDQPEATESTGHQKSPDLS